MFDRIRRKIREWRDETRIQAGLRFIAEADPDTQWREINARVDEILPLMPPLPDDMPAGEEAWARFVEYYERRKATGEFGEDTQDMDDLVYGRKTIGDFLCPRAERRDPA